MSFLFKRSKKVIYHIDSLNKNMKTAIKTIIDCSMPDIAKGYGMRYAIPKWGEPIFVPYGELDGDFDNTKDAFSRIEEAISESASEALSYFKGWYPDSIFLNHYRVSYYSFTHESYGYVAGIGADPLISHKYFELPSLKDKKVFVASPALSMVTEYPFYDQIYEHKDEIVEAYSWANSEFHSKYDKDNVYDEDIGKHYMSLMFERIRDKNGRNVKNQVESADVLLVPLFTGQNKYGNGSSIKESWMNSDFYKKSMYHEFEALPVIWNTRNAEILVQDNIGKFSQIVLLFDKGVPSIDKCKEDCMSDSLKSLVKVVEDKERYKVIEPLK
ncbi:hypothetical protein [Sulfuracidifex tepidarius]|uniref:Uncharacterized protein n=1 Tax=Sulfuracidifex tepidarius TaxID=1294262 RepID=A0A510E6V8_9CREN|nr:hypothetical protein [Sulfuracidifex tepidarius]BBG25468.1 hypothetical protein IC006_2804 [Sulfuracidifex tepidarius]BBG28262.1 hypothetical protein IC007_2818 [Sulfuracidifex tepidarius]